jgi:hypothetical protein
LVKWFWRRSRKCQSLQIGRRTDKQTERLQTMGDQKSSFELSVQVS